MLAGMILTPALNQPIVAQVIHEGIPLRALQILLPAVLAAGGLCVAEMRQGPIIARLEED